MCKFKDTTLGIKKLDFNVKRGAMAAYLTDGREIIVPVSMFLIMMILYIFKSEKKRD